MNIACPKPACADNEWDFATPGALAAHLIEDHAMKGMAALALAKETTGVEVRSMADAIAAFPNARSGKEQPTMSCKTCGQSGHRKDSPQSHPKAGTNGVGKSGAPRGPVAGKKRKPITRRHPRPPAKAQDGNGLVSEISALGAVAAALESLDGTGRKNVLACICKLLAIDPSTLAA